MEGYGKSFIIIRFDIAVANVGVAAQVTSRFNDQSFKVERNVCPLMKKVIALEGVYVYAKEAQRQREEAAAALAIESLLCRQNRR